MAEAAVVTNLRSLLALVVVSGGGELVDGSGTWWGGGEEGETRIRVASWLFISTTGAVL